MSVLALTHHNGIRIAELAYVLVAVGGALFIYGATPGGGRIGNIGGGLALVAAAVLLVVAAHWGHYG